MESASSSAAGSLHGTEIGCYVAYSIGISIIILRLYTRAYITHSLGLDDIFIVASALSSTAIIVTVRIMFRLGIGRHISTLTEYEILHARQAMWISLIFYNFALGLIKTSIVALYLRLTVSTKNRIILYVVGTLLLSNGIASSIVTAHVCTPISTIWSPTFPRGCLNLITLSYFNSAFNVVSDIVLAVLPIPILYRLSLPRRKKIGLSIVFGIGILTIGATLARQVSYFKALHARDFSGSWARTELLTNIEINMAITFACVPAIQTLINACFRSPQPPLPLYQDPPDPNIYTSSGPSCTSSAAKRGSGKTSGTGAGTWWAGRRVTSGSGGDSVREITAPQTREEDEEMLQSESMRRGSRVSTHSRPRGQSASSRSAASSFEDGGLIIIQSTASSTESIRGGGRRSRRGNNDDDWQSLESGVLGASTWKGSQSVSVGRGSKVLVKGEEVLPLRDWKIVAGGVAKDGRGRTGVVKSVGYRVEYS